jgi:predicted DNA-binding transcriptional regulator YafY
LSVPAGNVPGMNRTDRLYALVEELRAVAPRPRSARQLAGHYEVCTRTIERDILALQESGVPIYAEPGRRGGYVIDAARTLPPVNFTAAELVAVAVTLARAGTTPFAAATRSALRKVLAAAPPGQAAEATELMNRVRLIDLDRPGGGPAREKAAWRWAGQPGQPGQPGQHRQPARSVPLAIQEAITARHVLRIDYRDRGDRVTVREVEPVVFAATRAQWYLLGWCRLRDAGRAFRLDRILAAADTGEPAPHRSYADLRVDIPDAIIRQPELSG